MGLSKLTTILLDGDGVLWKADDPIPGIKPFFDFLTRKSINWALLTNNNTRMAKDYVDKFQNFGIDADDSIVFTSPIATATYALECLGEGVPLHVIGMDGLISTLQNAGFRISFGETHPPHDVEAVVAGEDLQINYDKIKVAMRLIMKGAKFIATNTDSTHPTPDGINPGTGLVIGALQATTNTVPIVIGKPQTIMFEMAIKRFRVSPKDVLMVGDTLETDILGASRMGIRTAAVLSGVTTKEKITHSKVKPDFIFEDIAHFHKTLEKMLV